MPSIFDLVTAADIAAYWETLAEQRAPYLGEQLFPADKKLGLDLSWIKGNSGLPVVLNLSAFDANVIPRARAGFELMKTQMPFFKESLYIDEELRQQLNMVLETGKQAYIDVVMRRLFDDTNKLLEGARAQRERIRMSILMTGAVSLASNGQAVSYDYSIPNTHKDTVDTTWGASGANVVEDIRSWQDKIAEDTGVRPTRMICNSTVWSQMLRDEAIKNTIFVYSQGVSVISDAALRSFLADQLGVTVHINDKKYKNELGAAVKYVPDFTVSLVPEGQLGTSWFGTTPEESDLMSSSVANVSIVDTGVAITTIEKADPVNVETKVSQIFLPSFEQSDQVFIAETKTN